MTKSRQRFTPAEIEELRRAGWVCQACGADLTKVEWHVDHMLPRSRRGLQVLCAKCNVNKSDQTDEEWRGLRKMPVALLAARIRNRRRTLALPQRSPRPKVVELVEERTSSLSAAARRRIKKRRREAVAGKRPN